MSKACWIVLAALLPAGANGQSFLSTSAWNKGRLAGGIEENRFLQVCWRPAPGLQLVCLNSLYVWGLEYQTFSAAVFYTVTPVGRFKASASGGVRGRYRDGIEAILLSSEAEWPMSGRFGLSAGVDVLYGDSLRVRPRIGSLFAVDTTISCIAGYVMPRYGTESAFDAGVVIHAGSLMVKSTIQLPRDLDHTFARVMLSYLYVFY